MPYLSGTRLRKQINKYLNKKGIRNSISINAHTKTNDNWGGYEGDSFSSSSTSTYCIPVNEYVQTELGLVKYGDLKKGELRVLLKYDESIDENDTVTYQSLTYLVRRINPIVISDITVAQDVLLSRELS